MRKLVYSLTNSLDNFIARADGGYDWILMGDEIMSEFPKIYAAFDTILIGRKTYDQTLQQSPGTGQEMEGFMGMKTFLFSRTMKESPNAGVKVISDNAGEFVRSLKKESGKDIWLFGGGLLFRSLLKLGLVDTVEVAVIPVLVGGGIPLLPPPAGRAKLKLTGHRVYKKSGIVFLEYVVR